MMVIFQISRQLFFSPAVIFFSMPYFHFNNILYAIVIYDYVCSAQIPCSCLYIIISRSI